MKKLFITSVALVIVLSGCSFGKKQQTATEAPKAGLTIGESRTLTQWLKEEPTIDCSVTTPEGKITIKGKNGKVRIEGIPYFDSATQQAAPGTSITDGDNMYIWSGNQGIKMSIQKMKETADSAATTTEKQEPQSWEDSASAWEKAGYEYTCAKNNISDDLFVVPANVNFTDMTQILNSINTITATSSQNDVLDQVGQDVQDKIKKGETVNQEDIEAQIEQMQKAQGDAGTPVSE